MTPSIVLNATERLELLDLYRKHPNPEVRFRAHLLLLLDDGHSWQEVGALLYCSSRTIDRWVKRFQHDGIAALAGRRRGRPFRFAASWARIVVAMVLHLSSAPVRLRCAAAGPAVWSPWPCSIGLTSTSVARRSAAGSIVAAMVYRRPRPIVGPRDAQREAKLAALHKLLEDLPADETVVWQDEVDINTNPEIGRMGMRPRPAKPGTPRRGPMRSTTWPGRSTGGPGSSWPPRGRSGTRSCSWPTWRSCGGDCGDIVRSM